MNVRRIIACTFALAVVALIVGLSGCEKAAQIVPDAKTEMPEMMEETIPIGIAVALTGEYAEPYGLPMKRGLDLAREEINGHSHAHIMTHDHGNIMFVEVDAQSTAEGGVAAVQELVDQGVPAIIGIGISTHLEQAFPIAQENGVVAFSPISSATGLSALGDYIFRAGLTVGVLNSNGTMVTHEQLGYKKAALIYDAADTYSTSSNETFEKTLEAIGVEILTVETFQTDDTDFSTQLTSIMNMAPDALFISALAPEMVQIITQASEVGIPDTVQLVVPDLTSTEIEQVGDAAEGAITFGGWFGMADTPGNAAFIQNYQTKYGYAPERWAAEAYATLHILANAIANAQSTDPAMIRDALAQTMDFPTILGNFSFDPDGEAVYDPSVFIVKDGELQPFEAAAPQMATHTEPTIPIGVAVALTGPFAEPYGLPMKRGLDLAREEINGHSHAHIMTHDHGNIMFVEVDAQSTAEGGVAAVQELVDQGVPAIIGIGISTHLEQAFPIAQENGVVAFSPISSATGLSALGDYIFRAGLTVGVLNSNGTMVTHEQLGYKKAALIYDAADTYSTSSNEAFEKTLGEIGVEVLTVETFQTGDTDFSAQLTNIMGMAPDALFISALAPEMTQVITQAREIGIPDTVQLVVPDLTSTEIEQVDDAAEGAITFSGWSGLSDIPENQDFIQKYQAAYGHEPGPWAAQAYATLYILANAINEAQSVDSAAIRDALAQTMNFPTVLGNFSFDPNGEAVYDPIIFMVKDGKLQLFE